ncbi:hypothetical protein J31TS4_43430 [Paenibacillus sp. J31TS4]|uniref:c-type cytochrome n=1 Tax=Paenibacillus sp. J31TS4 TaxID=2807195 RepID=UPI001B11AB29|nr:cytochrome c [Paenibacillus sp. J31TS4]GIP41063.1 hypothetical protein J31TS4_43430 [Paenibacillus sp. J31TS4]
MNKKIGALVLAAALVLALGACGKSNDNKTGQGTSPGATTTPGATTGGGTAGGGTAQAEQVYKANCLACHGDNLEGKMGGNSNLTKVGARRSKEQIVTQISNGGNGMPGFKGRISDTEINALADWLAAKK